VAIKDHEIRARPRRLGAGLPAYSGRSAESLVQFTEIFFHKNVTDFFTPAPAERLHHPLRLSLEMGFK
jgi:hypothetical protein